MYILGGPRASPRPVAMMGFGPDLWSWQKRPSPPGRLERHRRLAAPSSVRSKTTTGAAPSNHQRQRRRHKEHGKGTMRHESQPDEARGKRRKMYARETEKAGS